MHPVHHLLISDLRPTVLRVAVPEDARVAYRIAVYVGQTSKTPEERSAQHKAGIKASRWVRDHGIRLRPDLFEQPCLRSKAESLTYEALLAARLRADGWTVKGGT